MNVFFKYPNISLLFRCNKNYNFNMAECFIHSTVIHFFLTLNEKYFFFMLKISNPFLIDR